MTQQERVARAQATMDRWFFYKHLPDQKAESEARRYVGGWPQSANAGTSQAHKTAVGSANTK